MWLFTLCLDQVNLYLFAPFLCLVQMLHFPSVSIAEAESLIFFPFSLSAGWLLLILLHPQVYYNFSLYFRTYKMQFSNFRMAQFVFSPEFIRDPSLLLSCFSFHLSPLQFWSPGWNSPLLILLSHLQMFVLSFSQRLLCSHSFGRLLSSWVQCFRNSLWEWCCLPGRGGTQLWLWAAPELWLESSSNSCLPVVYFQSLFMGIFTALQHPHIFLNLLFITSVPWSYECWFLFFFQFFFLLNVLLLIKHDPCTCFLFDLICLWVKFYISNPGWVFKEELQNLN